jgi:hypothetical protein
MNEPRRVRIELCQPCAVKLRAECGFMDLPAKLEPNEVQKMPLAQRETLTETFLRVLCDECLAQAGMIREEPSQ